jgi:hypothetical protein
MSGIKKSEISFVKFLLRNIASTIVYVNGRKLKIQNTKKLEKVRNQNK